MPVVYLSRNAYSVDAICVCGAKRASRLVVLHIDVKVASRGAFFVT